VANDSFNSAGGGVTPINLATGTAGAVIPIGVNSGGCNLPNGGIASSDIAMSPDGGTAYLTSPMGCTANLARYGLVTAIDTATNTTKWSLTDTFDGPNAIAITPDGGTAYVTALGSAGAPGFVFPIDLSTQTEGSQVNLCAVPNDIVISPNGTTAYITCQNSVYVLDLATNTVSATIAVPVSASSNSNEAITPNGQTLYVTDPASDRVIPISTATNVVGTPISVSSSPVGMAITPDGSSAYVVGSNATVTSIDLTTATAGTPITLPGPVNTGTVDIAIH
jgi:YVTN family beta-propeller protein